MMLFKTRPIFPLPFSDRVRLVISNHTQLMCGGILQVLLGWRIRRLSRSNKWKLCWKHYEGGQFINRLTDSRSTNADAFHLSLSAGWLSPLVCHSVSYALECNTFQTPSVRVSRLRPEIKFAIWRVHSQSFHERRQSFKP